MACPAIPGKIVCGNHKDYLNSRSESKDGRSEDAGLEPA